MHRIVPTVTTLPQHFHAIEQTPDVYRPPRCPHCGLGVLWRHGCYSRKADRHRQGGPSRNPVPIRRYCCAGCRRTCSRLPLCIAPRRWHDWSVQHQALHRLICGWSLHRTCDHTCLARRTVRRWRDWLVRRSEKFAFHLRSRFAHLGRAVDRCSFWKNVLDDMPLGRAMAWLDLDLCVP